MSYFFPFSFSIRYQYLHLKKKKKDICRKDEKKHKKTEEMGQNYVGVMVP